ncbi:MAG: alpha-galactosidase [Gorillibacterium sp.]|nr:alpha-galactosidase [Gorillibacterium sp.]
MKDERLTIALLPGEYWWGGKVADGMNMPYGQTPFKADLSVNLDGNQGVPLLISNRGRYVWSEKPFAFSFEDGLLHVESCDGILEKGEGHRNLREAYNYVSRTYFPPAGSYPDELLFTAPQYNLWIELLYEPTQVKVLAYAKSVLEMGMAPGVIMIDDNWHGPYGTWEFHSGRFPDPKGMIDELHAMGFKLMLWVCPFISPDTLVFRQLEPTGVLLKDSTGATAIRRWWNGCSAVLDCTNAKAVEWITGQLDGLQTKYGVDGFKLDAGDLDCYEASDMSAVPTSRNGHCEAWARIGLRYALNEYRACWKLGGQPLAQRLKDKHHSWEGNGLAALLPDGLAQGLLGYAFNCPDMIGGGEYLNFTANLDKLDAELFVRYAQSSALFPMMQFSAAPWRVLDHEHMQRCVDAAKLHERMAPEIMALVKDAAITGEPIMRHMAYVFPEEGMETVKDQFMLGDHLLVAPVLCKGARARSIQFPKGTWLGDDGSEVEGPCTSEIQVPLSRLPYYRRK